jgi:pimeloyl-ACP methyl ester carboxylesterase
MVAKYPARSPEKRADPIVYLAGGPGDIAPLEVNGLIAADFIRDRDIVVMSQRGTMFSEPALTCAAIDNFNRELLGLRFYSEATERAHLAATKVCHQELAATGADLSAYNSTESAADFADLRKVLGFAAWNVYGTSYGSYLAQTLMRDHPEGIRSVVLDSVLPTTYTIPGNWQNTRAGFDNLFQACATEMACNIAHPHLEKTFTGLVNKLEAEPLTTTVTDPTTGKDLKVLLDGGALVDWLRNQNYDVPLLRAAPDRIDGLAAGRPASISGLPGFDTTRGRRRMGVCQPRLPRGLEGPRRAGHNARARHQQHPDAPHFRQLRHPDFPRRGQGRGGTPCQCDHYQHSGHRPFCLPRISLRPNSRRILLRRSERPQHILRRRIEAA